MTVTWAHTIQHEIPASHNSLYTLVTEGCTSHWYDNMQCFRPGKTIRCFRLVLLLVVLLVGLVVVVVVLLLLLLATPVWWERRVRLRSGCGSSAIATAAFLGATFASSSASVARMGSCSACV